MTFRGPFAKLLVAACLGLFAGALAHTQSLPDLGESAQAAMSPAMERRLGESIMERIRQDRAYLDDAEVVDYLQHLGFRLSSASPDSRQAFEFFLIADSAINAFALPGGFIGIHTGLVLAAQSESELASVLAHEIAHVTQRHIARIIEAQNRTQLPTLAAIALAILASRSSPQASQAIFTGAQAASIQTLLDFTRDHEREADRVGLQIMERAGLDVRASALFMERMQRSNRILDNPAAPAFLRTHPVTHERIADVLGRVDALPYRQVPDNPDYQLLRAKLRAGYDDPRQAQAYFEEQLREGRYSSEAGARYGLSMALLRQREFAGASREIARLESLLPRNAIVAGLRGTWLRASGDLAGARAHFAAAMLEHPRSRPLAYAYAELLVSSGQWQQLLELAQSLAASFTADLRPLLLQSQAYAGLGRRLLHHRYHAEVLARLGNYVGAIEQLQFALKAGDGDFYQLSTVEARLRELKILEQERRRLVR